MSTNLHNLRLVLPESSLTDHFASAASMWKACFAEDIPPDTALESARPFRGVRPMTGHCHNSYWKDKSRFATSELSLSAICRGAGFNGGTARKQVFLSIVVKLHWRPSNRLETGGKLKFSRSRFQSC
jgi:hypothetical protein